MIRGYGSAREHLDDLIALTDRMLQRQERAAAGDGEADLRALAELDVDIAQREDLVAARAAATSPELPFHRACARFGLSATEERVLAFLVALELSSHVRPRATIGSLEALVYRTPSAREDAVEELAPDGRLFSYGLAELTLSTQAWLASTVRAVPRLRELAAGRLRLDVDVARVARLDENPPSASHLLVPAALPQLVEDAIRVQAGGFAVAHPVPMLVGLEGSGRASLVFGAAQQVGKPVLVVQASMLPRDAEQLATTLTAILREARLFDAVLLVRDLEALAGDDVRGAPDLVPRVANMIARYAGPSAVTATRACWPRAANRPTLTIELPIPSEAERSKLWRRTLDCTVELADLAAARYRVTGGLIERAATAARARTAARKTELGLDDVRVALRSQLDGELAVLGRLVDWKQTWDDLVLPADIIEELREMISRVRHRKRVLDEWGFQRKVGKGTGLSALFSGPPGTGKTMVAGLIAAELELDLYQIDVSRLVSKWVGETEKNLARLFDAAAAGHAVLLFDEADSLFAKRTDVKSSNDRYANLEVNYLLQRMEAFEGISILTTNLETSVDEAFRRRLAFRINFPLPEIEERERLWRAMLPTQAATAPNLDFHQLASRFEMSGGYIRNAVLRAAYLAAADGSVITQRHLHRAATLEYTAMGKIIHQSASLL